MASDVPAPTHKERTAWNNSPTPLAESDSLLHDDREFTAITTAPSPNSNIPSIGAEKKEAIESVAEVRQTDDLNHERDDHNTSTRHSRHPPCGECGHRPHRKPWTLLGDLLINPWRSFYKEEREVPKAVMNRPSISSLVGHFLVHIVPVLATGALIGMNLWNPRKHDDDDGIPRLIFEGWYIGAELWGPWGSEATLNFLQLAAKLHETVIVASLGGVAVDLVRYFLVYKSRGVPLGLLGAGSMYADMKYLISKELHGLWKTKYSTWAKILVFFAVFFFCALANLVGPSSAILLIPRNHTWTVADFAFHLNGTREDHLWPTSLTADHIGGSNCSPEVTDQFTDANCVSDAYGGIANYLKSFIAYPADHAFAFTLQDSRSTRQIWGSVRQTYVNHYTDTWTMAPHAATVTVTEPIRSGWNIHLHDVNHNFRFASERSIQVNTTSPVVRSACQPVYDVTAKVYTDPETNEKVFPMEFPILLEEANWVPQPPVDENGNKEFNGGPVANVSIPASILDLDLPSNFTQPFIVRTKWIDLPQDLFPFARSGVIILMSGADHTGPHDEKLMAAFGCVADARWTRSENTVESSMSDWGSAAYAYATKTTFLSTRDPPEDAHGHEDRLFLPSREKGWQAITLTQEWLEALTPPMTRRPANNLVPSTLGAILEDWIPTLWAVAEHNELKKQIWLYTNPKRYEMVIGIEHAVASLVADGVARVGLGMQGMIWDLARPLGQQPVGWSLGADLPAPFNGSTVDEMIGIFSAKVDMSERNEKLVMTAKVNGYGLRMAGRGGLFAMVIMCTYLGVVVLHVVFVVVWLRGRTMAAFESQTELLLLGMAGAGGHDKQTQEMMSCGGLGVERAATYARIVRVGTVPAEKDGESEHGEYLCSGGDSMKPPMQVKLSLGGESDPSRGDLGLVMPGEVYR